MSVGRDSEIRRELSLRRKVENIGILIREFEQDFKNESRSKSSRSHSSTYYYIYNTGSCPGFDTFKEKSKLLRMFNKTEGFYNWETRNGIEEKVN